jgi:hypothetical protein
MTVINEFINPLPKCFKVRVFKCLLRFVNIAKFLAKLGQLGKLGQCDTDSIISISISICVALKVYLHWRSLLAKPSATATCNSHYCTCLGHLGRNNRVRIIDICLVCFISTVNGHSKLKKKKRLKMWCL